MATTQEKRQALNNDGDIVTGRIISNFSDALFEDYHFDILSKFLVVALEPIGRVLTSNKQLTMLAICLRPKSLWLNVEGGVTGDPTTQSRSDASGNVYTGPAINASTGGIAPINYPYQLGGLIKMRKLPTPLTTGSIFQSQFTQFDSTNYSYIGLNSPGASLPYITNGNFGFILNYKNIIPNPENSGIYNFILFKFQYESMMLLQNLNNQTITNGLTAIFNGTWNSQNSDVFSANGGYLFQNAVVSQIINSIMFEDLNEENRSRVPTNDCIPLVVSTPASWPTPSSRTPGLISYSPQYSQINIT